MKWCNIFLCIINIVKFFCLFKKKRNVIIKKVVDIYREYNDEMNEVILRVCKQF